MNLYTRMKFCIVASFIEGRLESLLPKKRHEKYQKLSWVNNEACFTPRIYFVIKLNKSSKDGH